MAMIHYFGGGDELPNASASFVDEDASWWVGVQRCGALLALATAALLNSASAAQAQSVANSWQDDPAGNLTATVDEYFWQNPVPPIGGYAPPQLILDDVVIVPQPPPFQPDEDFWQNPVIPYVAAIVMPAPWAFDEQTPVLFGQFDEDFWNSGVAPICAYPVPQLITDDGNFVPSALRSQIIWLT